MASCPRKHRRARKLSSTHRAACNGRSSPFRRPINRAWGRAAAYVSSGPFQFRGCKPPRPEYASCCRSRRASVFLSKRSRAIYTTNSVRPVFESQARLDAPMFASLARGRGRTSIALPRFYRGQRKCPAPLQQRLPRKIWIASGMFPTEIRVRPKIWWRTAEPDHHWGRRRVTSVCNEAMDSEGLERFLRRIEAAMCSRRARG